MTSAAAGCLRWWSLATWINPSACVGAYSVGARASCQLVFQGLGAQLDDLLGAAYLVTIVVLVLLSWNPTDAN